MQQGSTSTGPIMRLFEVQTKPGWGADEVNAEICHDIC